MDINKGLNGFQLKILALVFMTLDHLYFYHYRPSCDAYICFPVNGGIQAYKKQEKIYT